MKFIVAVLILCASFQCDAAGWIQQSDFGGVARHRTTMLSLGNKIYAGLGHYNGAGTNVLFDDWWQYDPATNAWTQKADYLGGICYHAAGFAIDDIGYVGTGRISETGNTLVKDFFKYSPTTNTWTQITDFPGTGRRGAVGFSIGAYGYVGTGTSSDDMYRYDPSSNSWTQVASVPGGDRESAVGFELNGFGYLGTGFAYNFAWSSTDFYKYNPSTDQWTPIADVGIDPIDGPIPRMEASAFSVNGKGYVLTGDNISSGDNYKDMWELDPATDTWTRIDDFEGTARRYLSATALNGYGYVGLGTNGTNFKDFWKFDQTLSLIERNLDAISIHTFPNPCVDFVNFDIAWPEEISHEKVNIRVHSLTGRLLYSGTITQGKNTIAVERWPSGLNIYALYYEETLLKTGKIIVQ